MSESSSDFREIVRKGDAGKADRLFRAAVSAFCSLTRPSRRDTRQLDDLTLPLFDAVAGESLRYVAAALSECETAPKGLVSRLCDQSVDIAAPLLVRCKGLTDVDLIGLVSRHGVAHARAIARRPSLNPAIANLVRALESATSAEVDAGIAEDRAAHDGQRQRASDHEAPPARRGDASDQVRERLRAMMRPDLPEYEGATIRPIADPTCFSRLRDTAITGNATFFHTALADALRLNLPAARAITETSSYSALLAALKSLELTEEQAYLVTAAIFPREFGDQEAIRLFLGRYRALRHETALERVRGWKVEMVSAWIKRNAHPDRDDLTTVRHAAEGNSSLKAS